MAGGGEKSNKHRKVGRCKRSKSQATYNANSQWLVNKARRIIQATRKSGGAYQNDKELQACGVLAIRAACRKLPGVNYTDWAK